VAQARHLINVLQDVTTSYKLFGSMGSSKHLHLEHRGTFVDGRRLLSQLSIAQKQARRDPLVVGNSLY
jgi:hypothetical protein